MSSATTNQPFVFTHAAAPVAGIGTDSLVNETRREIAEIVREVAIAVRSDRTADEFLTMLVDRILRAMAAEGVMVWRRCDSATHSSTGYGCIRRLGRITDESIPAESIATHARLLSEVAGDGQPVVVPATPGASDTEVSANPMDVAVALVPIECEPSPDGVDYLLEVFLESDCGVATQRGYLRFVAQMADLAGEFLRADQLRQLRRNQILSRDVDAGIAKLHDARDRCKLEAAIVDGAAELFSFDRVALCLLEPKVTISAVNHVNTIDKTSPAARQLREAATTDLDADGSTWIESVALDPTPDDSLRPRAVVGFDSRRRRRLVCMQIADTDPVSTEFRGELLRYVRHAELALRNVSRLDAIPGGRLLASLAPVIERRIHRGWRTAAITVAVITALVVVSIFPVPLVVYSAATIRPASVQTLTSPRDAIADQIHVRHGQQVSRGEELLTMVDPALEEQITALVGRRAVSVQQRSHWTQVLVDNTSRRLDQMERVQGERSLAGEEIQSIDDQLAVLKRVKASLVIRAGRDGIVDAWQIEQRLQSRPLRRGDPLLQVVAKDTSWVVDVQVPQSRIAHLQHARNLRARVSLDADPNQSFDASLIQIGPSVVGDQRAVSSTAVLLRLSDQATRMIASDQGGGHPSGAPARVMFHCGKTSAAYLVFQDLIRSLRGTFALYLATDADNSGDWQ